jgi:hypothetical protein
VSRIAAHIDRPLDEDGLRRVCDRVFSHSSATFRKGQIGDWRNHFSPAQVELFKERAGDSLLRMKYESDFNW